MAETENITVTLVGKESDVSFESFAVVVQAMRNLLNELDKNHSLKWQIKQATTNSPLFMEIESPITSRDDRRVVDDYFQFMRNVPIGASRNAVNQVNTIRNVVSKDSVSHIDFGSRGREGVTVWPRVKKTVTAQPTSSPYAEYACSVELIGSLEIASSEHDERAFFVRDRIKGTKVRCEATDNIWVQALDAMKTRTSPRVAVFGRAQYRDDRPYKMKVETFEVLPTLENHPGLYAVQGIDITGGMDSVAYVRSLRDGA